MKKFWYITIIYFCTVQLCAQEVYIERPAFGEKSRIPEVSTSKEALDAERQREEFKEKNKKIADFARAQDEFDALAKKETTAPLSQTEQVRRNALEEQLNSLNTELVNNADFQLYKAYDQIIKDFYQQIERTAELPIVSEPFAITTYAEFKSRLDGAQTIATINALARAVDTELFTQRVRDGIKKFSAVPEKQLNITKAIDEIESMRDDVSQKIRDIASRGNQAQLVAYTDVLQRLDAVSNQLQELSNVIMQDNIGFWNKLAQWFKESTAKLAAILGLYKPERVIEIIRQQTGSNKAADNFLIFVQSIRNGVKNANRIISEMQRIVDDRSVSETQLEQVSNNLQDLERQLKNQIKLLDESENLFDSLNSSLAVAQKFDALLFRYTGNFTTLAEKIGNYLREQIGIINPYTEPDALYQVLGLSVDQPEKLSQQDIENAYRKKLSEVTVGSSEYVQLQKAGYLLRSPEHRAVYDAFINDIKNLQLPTFNLAFDTAQELIRSKQNQLNDGDLAKLAIDQTARNTFAQQMDKYLPIELDDMRSDKSLREILEEQLEALKQLKNTFADVLSKQSQRQSSWRS